MKHRKTWMALLLCAALLLSGCAGKQEDAKEETSQTFHLRYKIILTIVILYSTAHLQ